MELSNLIYSNDRSGSLKLYCLNAKGFHNGGQWMAKKIKYPDEEITFQQGKDLADEHRANGGEVRICNGGDLLVFHAKGLQVLYPLEGAEAFWNSL